MTSSHLLTPELRVERADFYRRTLTQNVLPFWLTHGLDREHGGMLTCLDRDGSVLDTDKSTWFQGRAAWTYATLFTFLEPREDWLEAATSCLGFLSRHGRSPEGKYHFTTTREGRPLRMRRYAYSEAFAAIAYAACHGATGDPAHARAAQRDFAAYLHLSFDPGATIPKVNPDTRPMRGIGPLMIGISTAQELRTHLGDVEVSGRCLSTWIAQFISTIRELFYKPGMPALLETVAPDGGIIDHFEGRALNPGHALECAWFVLLEGKRNRNEDYTELGLSILDCMWERGWDSVHGGLFYFRDLHHRPVQEYWHDMKFWWPHCEAIIATLLAWRITGEERYACWYEKVHDWSFQHFPDEEHGEWYGYLHRDGRLSVPLKGNLWKGPFHLPRMLWIAASLLQDQETTS